MTEIPKPPVAPRKPHSFTRHGITVEDPYAWLRDPGYPEVTDAEVLAYLNAENAYFEAVMAPHKGLTQTIFNEMKGRVKDDDSSVPQRDGDFLYWYAFDAGAEYRKWYRRPAAGGGDVVILDEPKLAEGHQYFRLGGLAVSPDQRLLAYAVDTNGSERYVLRVRDLETGADLPDVIENWRYGLVWAADSKSFLYTDADENWRSKTVWHHRLGDAQSADRAVYTEAAEEFGVQIGRTQSRKYAVLQTGDHTTSEVRLLPTDDFAAAPVLVSPRKADRQYDVDEREGTLYIRVNDTHPNFRVVTASVAVPDQWSELIAGSDRHYIQSATSFENLLVIEERVDGLSQIRLRRYADGGERYVAFPEASFVATLSTNPEYRIDRLRIDYQSMVTPNTVYDYHLADDRLETLKVREIPSGYDPSQYATERLMAPARDGTLVPVSVVYRKDFVKDGRGPLHIYAYGAYGFAFPPGFSANRLSLLDRGFAYAIAHIRGGDDLGYRWYLDGKLDKRPNTFNDFVDVTRFLIEQGFASPGRVTASGGSAGGELMGAIANQAPELYGAVAAHVPFVDVLNTMLDDTLPLTPGEWPEWGNPIADKAAFELIRSYSPYDNVKPQAYPALLITGGLNDPRVTYWEPAKWAAKLRAAKTDDKVLLLKTNMGAGHGGKSGRYVSLEEDAEEYAFLISQIGR
ncbi:S9 family peptidase [Sphingosinicella microcystinivorans]|uniref:S9 family peptidase n=1 Tax=Sphingosinicella microcystinivorans TaxID=335406 RepID=UPI0022F3D962|nr:S9 family peptidase [Sphingosinicella microcystinivorans]WBX85767.1 S9 family peptidase [Sphingosinicella microcystinivorans]